MGFRFIRVIYSTSSNERTHLGATVIKAFTVVFFNYKDPFIAELLRTQSTCSRAPWVRQFGKLSIQENLVTM